MDPIAVYRERLLQVSRRFELYPDRVEVQARWRVSGGFTTTVHLAGLDPNFRAVFIRNKLFKVSLFLLLAGVVIIFFAGNIERLRAMEPVPVTGLVVTFLGVALGWLTSRRIRFALFQSRLGRPGLDIGCAGPDKANFEQFLLQIQRQIRKAAKQSNNADKRNS
jgi:hypothetical protein